MLNPIEIVKVNIGAYASWSHSIQIIAPKFILGYSTTKYNAITLKQRYFDRKRFSILPLVDMAFFQQNPTHLRGIGYSTKKVCSLKEKKKYLHGNVKKTELIMFSKLSPLVEKAVFYRK